MTRLEQLLELGWLSPIDAHFARWVEPDDAQELVTLAAALASRALREGHVCLPLRMVAGTRIAARARISSEGEDDPEPVTLPEADVWLAALERSDAVATATALRDDAPQDQEFTRGDLPREARPLVLDADGRLYLHRYREHEERLARALRPMLRAPSSSSSSSSSWDAQAALDRYFPLGRSHPLQRRAAEAALESRLTVISGGPGTGKTSTVVSIIALLVERAVSAGQPVPRVKLLAPTGKAAARVGESIKRAKAELGLSPEIRDAIVERAHTIHRALGVMMSSRTRFRRSAHTPLDADVVLVDEASMVDLALMRQLVEAIPAHAQLILLGDRFQLASVEAGSVLSELCEALQGEAGFVELTKSYRFDETSGIFALASAVREGDSRLVVQLCDEGRADLVVEEKEVLRERPALRRVVVDGYRRALKMETPAEALDALSEFRVLAAHRTGAAGVEQLNTTIRDWLVEAAIVPSSGTFYRGRLVMVTRNDPAVDLSNGDIGLVWPDEDGNLRVFFESPGEVPRRLSPAHLPEHETAFAMTIHKSQGSEYGTVAIVLPEPTSPLLTRELAYTAITRARRRALLFGTEPHSAVQALEAAASRTVVRYSGLRSVLCVDENPR